MTVAAILKEKGHDVVTVHPSASLADIASVIASRKIGAVVVLGDDRALAGIVSERDVVRAVASHGEAAFRVSAADIMTRNVTTASSDTTVNEAMALMDHGYFRHLPVIEDGALIGIISVRDVVRAVIGHQAHEVDSLKAYVFRGGQQDGLR